MILSIACLAFTWFFRADKMFAIYSIIALGVGFFTIAIIYYMEEKDTITIP